MDLSKSPAEPMRLLNRLADSTSPYVRSHQHDPVAWQEWTPVTVSLAKKLNRLIFLSIGYHACHWCHVMQQESFNSSEVADLLNSSFIPIKLDREARPDIDEIYMSYVTATTGSGGWPLNVFLTPDLEPVFGGTYWPGPGTSSLTRSGDSAGEDAPLNFFDILKKMQDIWSIQRERCKISAHDATQQLRSFAAEGMYSEANTKPSAEDTEPLDLDLLDDALSHLRSRYDPLNAGFSPQHAQGPKFPTPPNLSFLLRIGASITTTSTRFGFPSPMPPILGKSACAYGASMALQTLLTISRSGLRDHLGYGFHRYSVTSDWNLPHFEKMLPDNALLLNCYCDAWALSKNPEILGTIYNLVEYFTAADSPVVRKNGGLLSSEDADSMLMKSGPDSEAREGAFYVWSLKELEVLLGEKNSQILARHFGMTADGNVPAEHDKNDEFLRQNVLHIAATPSTLAKDFGMSEEEIVKIIKAGRSIMAENRNKQRQPPAVDTKIILSWNALAISALCRASNTLAEIDQERSKRCKVAALHTAAFITNNLYDAETGQLKRFHAIDSPTNTFQTAFLDDYAYLGAALMSLYDLTFDPSHLTMAHQLQAYLDTHFLDPANGGYFQAPSTPTNTPSEHIVRLKPGTDNSLPSPNGVIATNLFYLASYSSTLSPADVETPRRYIASAKRTIDAFAVEVIQHPFLFVSLLGAVVLDAVGVRGLVVQGDVSESEVRALNGWGRTVVKSPGVGAERKVMLCEEGRCRELVPGELDRDEEYEDGEVEDTVVGGIGKENAALLRQKAQLERQRAESDAKKAVLESSKREIEEAKVAIEKQINR